MPGTGQDVAEQPGTAQGVFRMADWRRYCCYCFRRGRMYNKLIPVVLQLVVVLIVWKIIACRKGTGLTFTTREGDEEIPLCSPGDYTKGKTLYVNSIMDGVNMVGEGASPQEEPKPMFLNAELLVKDSEQGTLVLYPIGTPVIFGAAEEPEVSESDYRDDDTEMSELRQADAKKLNETVGAEIAISSGSRKSNLTADIYTVDANVSKEILGTQDQSSDASSAASTTPSTGEGLTSKPDTPAAGEAAKAEEPKSDLSSSESDQTKSAGDQLDIAKLIQGLSAQGGAIQPAQLQQILQLQLLQQGASTTAPPPPSKAPDASSLSNALNFSPSSTSPDGSSALNPSPSSDSSAALSAGSTGSLTMGGVGSAAPVAGTGTLSSSTGTLATSAGAVTGTGAVSATGTAVVQPSVPGAASASSLTAPGAASASSLTAQGAAPVAVPTAIVTPASGAVPAAPLAAPVAAPVAAPTAAAAPIAAPAAAPPPITPTGPPVPTSLPAVSPQGEGGTPTINFQDLSDTDGPFFADNYDERIKSFQMEYYGKPAGPEIANCTLPNYLMNNLQLCEKLPKIDILYVIAMSPQNEDRRNNIRQTFGAQDNVKGYTIAHVFITGQTSVAAHQAALDREQTQYGDIVQGDFMDGIEQLTPKTLLGLKWARQFCRKATYVMKIDEDMLIDSEKLLLGFLPAAQKTTGPRSMFCSLLPEGPMPRTGSRAFSRSLYPNTATLKPFCRGYTVLLTQSAISSLLAAAMHVPKVHVEDIFVFGILPTIAGTIDLYDVGQKRAFHDYGKEVVVCYRDQGQKCPLFVSRAMSTRFVELWNYIKKRMANPHEDWLNERNLWTELPTYKKQFTA